MADVNSTPGRPIGTEAIKPPETAFTAFTWMDADRLQGAAVDGRNLIALVNHAQDVAMGVAAIMELAVAHSMAEDSGEEPYLNRCDLGRLERLAIRALHGLSDHSEEIARGAS